MKPDVFKFGILTFVLMAWSRVQMRGDWASSASERGQVMSSLAKILANLRTCRAQVARFLGIGTLSADGSDVPYRYPDVWSSEKTSGSQRLVIAPHENQVELLTTLLQCMTEPFLLLLVLSLTRTDTQPGRYQAETPFSRIEVVEFLRQYRNFFEKDVRASLWIKSAEEEGLLVYDRHNLIYAYGPLKCFEESAQAAGLCWVNSIEVPDPHTHHYNSEFDATETALRELYVWHWSPLRQQD